MVNYRNDPTANAAIGAIDRELRQKARQAERLREKKRRGELTPEEEREARRNFTGIFRHLLEEALNQRLK